MPGDGRARIQLPGRDGPLVIPSPRWEAGYPPPSRRKVFAAAHVAAAVAAGGAPVIDWESTLRFREHLWAHGFGVAEAMDTAQRGMGLSWEQARELIARSAARAAEAGRLDALACGAGTDQLADGEEHPLRAIIDAYAEQVAFVQSAGAQVILMASRALAASARGPRDYLEVYGELLKQAERPVILHWLGEAFDPALRGYWGGGGFDGAAATVLELIDRAGGQVDGVKLSVLDAGREVSLRRRLPAGVRLYTGDDFNYASLIRGDADGSHSDALLGAFAAITAPGRRGAGRAGPGRPGGLRRGDGADGPAQPADLRAADLPLQDRGGLPGLAERAAAALRDAGRARAAAPGRAPDPVVRAGRRGPGADRAGACGDEDGRDAGPFGPSWSGMNGGIGLDRLSLNQATVKHLGLKEAVALCVRHDIPAIGLWRDRVAEAGLAEAAAAVRAAGLRVSSLCRGGFFTVADPDERRAALADNLAAIAEAAELGTGTLVLVCGGLPPGQRDLGLARRMIEDAIGSLVPEALRLGVRLGIEALHPMFCADRCVISSLGEALDLALRFPADAVGVVVDTYHVWWDARLADEIARAGRRIASFQVCDWVLPLPQDTLLGRGHLGDGYIDFGPVTAAVTAAGYDGDVEVEIFNAEVWDAPPDQTAATVKERFAAVLGGPPRR